MKLEIKNIPGKKNKYRVVFDGEDISNRVASLTLKLEAGRLPTAEIALVLDELDISIDGAVKND